MAAIFCIREDFPDNRVSRIIPLRDNGYPPHMTGKQRQKRSFLRMKPISLAIRQALI